MLGRDAHDNRQSDVPKLMNQSRAGGFICSTMPRLHKCKAVSLRRRGGRHIEILELVDGVSVTPNLVRGDRSIDTIDLISKRKVSTCKRKSQCNGFDGNWSTSCRKPRAGEMQFLSVQALCDYVPSIFDLWRGSVVVVMSSLPVRRKHVKMLDAEIQAGIVRAEGPDAGERRVRLVEMKPLINFSICCYRGLREV